VQPETTEELARVAREVWASGDNWLLLGGGSNTVASDDGFDGTVIRIATRGIERIPAEGVVRLRVQAGESWDDLVAHTVREGWSGIEALSGIPGLVGAAPVQNIGAYGQELSSTLVAVDFLDFATGDVRRMSAAELELGYRTSVFKQGLAGIVLTVELDLAENDDVTGAALSRPVAYAQLADELGVTIGTRVPAVELRRAVLRLRASKGMILDAADPDSVSAGSFFTNPIVSENFARSLPADAPRWPMTPAEPDVVTALAAAGAAGGQTGAGVAGAPAGSAGGGLAGGLAHGPYAVKLSAAWLIESAGIHRGFALPGSSAAISSKHTLALTNRGGATAAEIVQLAGYVQSRVQSEFGVILQPEPVLVGLTL
jgi:UDP-N-acetylmuramate dehydrogenase